MSIELTKAPPQSSKVSATDHKGGKTDASGSKTSGGFSALMSLFAADETGVDPAATDLSMTDPLALLPVDTSTLAALPTLPMVSTVDANTMGLQPDMTSALQASLLTAPGSLTPSPSLPTGDLPKSSLPMSGAITNTVSKLSVAEQGPLSPLMDSMPLQNNKDSQTQLQVDTLLGQKNAGHPPALSAIQLELREVKAPLTLPQTLAVPDAASAWVASGIGDMVLHPNERSGTKSALGASGGAVDAAFGQASFGAERARSVVEVAEPSAVIPDTSIAETISYWVTQGVQTAELKLDGFGDDPVEVSISLNGDQTQIDFRTDQADVRQALEGASAQLKELLSGEGLQLAGVSVGTSGKESAPGDEQRQRQGAKRALFTKTEAIGQVGSRAIRTDAGRALDIFV
jgi:flagellar hook-length control protein FliK